MKVGSGLFLKVWAAGSRDEITLGEHTCKVLVRPNFRTNNYDYALVVDGEILAPD